jgi:osmoprotectant transport system substrate-binding protein
MKSRFDLSPPVRWLRAAAVVVAGLLALTACATGNPYSPPGGSSSAPATLVVGSQQYYSNEIIAELYAQALEAKGYKINRQLQIGQREVYLPELISGKIDIFPEYSGNLLQYLDKAATAKSGAEVLAALPEALPDGLRILGAADAADQDSYNVTKEFAEKFGLVSIEDLKKVGGEIKVGANSEFAKRPYGPMGLKSVYGLDVTVISIDDSGGPLTVKALKDGKIQLADIYSADPSIAINGFVTLTDPKNLILPQNVVPVVSAKVDTTAAAIIDKVSAELSTADLVALNATSVKDQTAAAVIAKAWLTAKGLL